MIVFIRCGRLRIVGLVLRLGVLRSGFDTPACSSFCVRSLELLHAGRIRHTDRRRIWQPRRRRRRIDHRAATRAGAPGEHRRQCEHESATSKKVWTSRDLSVRVHARLDHPDAPAVRPLLPWEILPCSFKKPSESALSLVFSEFASPHLARFVPAQNHATHAR